MGRRVGRQSSAPPALKRLAQTATVTVGEMSSRYRMVPAFLIAGAQRAGTTSMYRALSQHPSVLKPVLHKGVHYFDTNHERGFAWYRGHFPTSRSAERVRRATTRAVTFESSPYYLSHPSAAERIARELPDARFLVLVRDPVERAYSAHAHELARGFETEDFETALDLEDQRLEGEEERILTDSDYVSHSHQHHAYVHRGEYVTYLRRLESHVDRERIHVVDSHDFFSDPQTTFAEVAAFLDLPPVAGDTIVFERHNARQRSALPEHLRRRLDEHFRPWDEQLASWLGRTPSWRR